MQSLASLDSRWFGSLNLYVAMPSYLAKLTSSTDFKSELNIIRNCFQSGCSDRKSL